MLLNLKYFREEILKLSQAEFAELVDLRQDAVSRMEKAPDQISIENLMKISQTTGYPIDNLLNIQNSVIEPLQFNKSLNEVISLKNKTSAIIDNALAENNQVDYKIEIFDQLSLLKTALNTLVRKPRVVFLGSSDVGKSSMINTLLGQERLPASWTPTTSIPILIKHIKERPTYMEEKTTVILKSENFETNIDLFDIVSEIEPKILKVGGYEILEEYGTRKKVISDSSIAILYLDSPILELCDLIDVPGYGTGDRIEDDMQALKSKNIADIVIYLSLTNGFLRGNELSYLKDVIDSIPPINTDESSNLSPLNNLYVVASQAQIVKDVSETNVILEAGADRFNSILPEGYWESRIENSNPLNNNKLVRERMFTFSKDSKEKRAEFEEDFKSFLENFSDTITLKTKKLITNSATEFSKLAEAQIEEIEREKIDKKEALAHVKEIEESLRDDNKLINDQMNKVLEQVNDLSELTHLKLNKNINEFMNQDSLIDQINAMDLENKKADKEKFIMFVNNKLHQILKDVIDESNKKVLLLTEEYFNALNLRIKTVKTSVEMENQHKNNLKNLFFSGLAGAATYGGLTFYMSTLGNLGGYILVTKAVGVLSAMGISVGGGAAAVTAISAIGGPVTLVIGLAITGAIITYSISGVGWKKSLAKATNKQFEKANAVSKYEEVLSEYWKETILGFKVGSKTLKDSLYSQLINEQKLLELNGVDMDLVIKDLKKLIKTTEELLKISI
ncbi:dynamin family protein [Planococcus wigleyi]|uniref:Dynamin family protein n=1 Tax=Planococcus wigleyi TaxID=2762216 RepID=A0ABR8WB54_9BACL|nr:dynamin family protein [Planococcus wigleyi]MBD8014212.1 dynamin family protein [Planococcus wigleyi]